MQLSANISVAKVILKHRLKNIVDEQDREIIGVHEDIRKG